MKVETNKNQTIGFPQDCGCVVFVSAGLHQDDPVNNPGSIRMAIDIHAITYCKTHAEKES